MNEKLALENGGPAFPCDVGIDRKTGQIAFIPTSSSSWNHGGMFLRDYFAGQAVEGWASRQPLSVSEIEQLAKNAYTIADAMLAERSKESV